MLGFGFHSRIQEILGRLIVNGIRILLDARSRRQTANEGIDVPIILVGKLLHGGNKLLWIAYIAFYDLGSLQVFSKHGFSFLRLNLALVAY